MPGKIEIGLVRAGQMRAAAAVLARSFQLDEQHVHLFPDPARRARALPHEFAAVCRDAIGLGHVHGASLDGRLAGIAVWLPPGTHPMSLRRQLRLVPDAARLFWAAPGSFGRVARFGIDVAGLHPPQPYWYLEAIGVVPEARGRGVGTRLLRLGLAFADRAAQPCYLETSAERNVRWYRAHGFEVRASGVRFSRGGPEFWTLLRPLRPG